MREDNSRPRNVKIRWGEIEFDGYMEDYELRLDAPGDVPFLDQDGKRIGTVTLTRVGGTEIKVDDAMSFHKLKSGSGGISVGYSVDGDQATLATAWVVPEVRVTRLADLAETLNIPIDELAADCRGLGLQIDGADTIIASSDADLVWRKLTRLEHISARLVRSVLKRDPEGNKRWVRDPFPEMAPMVDHPRPTTAPISPEVSAFFDRQLARPVALQFGASSASVLLEDEGGRTSILVSNLRIYPPNDGDRNVEIAFEFNDHELQTMRRIRYRRLPVTLSTDAWSFTHMVIYELTLNDGPTMHGAKFRQLVAASTSRRPS